MPLSLTQGQPQQPQANQDSRRQADLSRFAKAKGNALTPPAPPGQQVPPPAPAPAPAAPAPVQENMASREAAERRAFAPAASPQAAPPAPPGQQVPPPIMRAYQATPQNAAADQFAPGRTQAPAAPAPEVYGNHNGVVASQYSQAAQYARSLQDNDTAAQNAWRPGAPNTADNLKARGMTLVNGTWQMANRDVMGGQATQRMASGDLRTLGQDTGAVGGDPTRLSRIATYTGPDGNQVEYDRSDNTSGVRNAADAYERQTNDAVIDGSGDAMDEIGDYELDQAIAQAQNNPAAMRKYTLAKAVRFRRRQMGVA